MRFAIYDLRFTRGLRVLGRLAGWVLAGFVLSALLTSCHGNDAELRKQVVGTWENGMGQMRIYAEGNFRSKISEVLTTGPKKWNGDGLWQVEDGFFVATITNSVGFNSTHFEPAGSIDRYKIIKADSTSLVLEIKGQNVTYNRR